MLSPLPDALMEPLQQYLELLDRWNRIHALTALSREDRFEELILDSAALLPYLQDLAPGSKLMDFGTGMGVPAVVLALARPDLQVVALDKSKKKIAFLKQVSLELRLQNLRAVAELAEHLPPVGAGLGVAKAVGSLELLTAWWLRHGLPGAALLAMKGPEWQQEAVPPGWELVAHPYQLPTRGTRVILHMKKIAGPESAPRS